MSKHLPKDYEILREARHCALSDLDKLMRDMVENPHKYNGAWVEFGSPLALSLLSVSGDVSIVEAQGKPMLQWADIFQEESELETPIGTYSVVKDFFSKQWDAKFFGKLFSSVDYKTKDEAKMACEIHYLRLTEDIANDRRKILIGKNSVCKVAPATPPQFEEEG